MSKISVHEIVTDKVLNALANGTAPWRKPWVGGGIRPCNAVTGRQYSGGNYFLLSMLPFAVPAFMTFNQIKAAGATIKTGEEKRHVPVFYWKVLERKNDQGKIETIPMLRYFLVWNVEQVEGYVMPDRSTNAKFTHDAIETAERILNGYANAPKISIVASDRACYNPRTDAIVAPELSQYPNREEYYSTLFHELGHSTGHKDRLNRKEVMDATFFGSHDYSLEELTAELCAAFLCAEAGIDNTLDNSAAYIAGWHKRLQNDPKMFWTAAGRAQKAADHILGRNKGKGEGDAED